MRPNQAGTPRLDPDRVYRYCLYSLREELPHHPTPSSMPLNDLLWSLTVSTAHAIEIAGRGFGTLEGSDPLLVPKRIASLVLKDGLPSKGDLYDLWFAWDRQYSDWPMSDTLNVPLYFCLCQMRRLDSLIELNQRFRRIDRPVFRGWMGLTAGPSHPDAVRLKRFFDAMDASLKSTVKRRLGRTQGSPDEDAPSSMIDEENIALDGAAQKLSSGQAGVLELFSKEGWILPKSGQPMDTPSIPVLPIRGMKESDGLNAAWRDNAKKTALRCLAAIAPGIFGLLETALPDAAHAAQQKERDHADAKKRGGTGGRKAEKAGTAEPAVQHVSIGEPDFDSDSESGHKPDCADPVDDRLNRQQETEKHEEEAENRKRAQEVYRIAIERWGESGRKMIEAYLVEGSTDETAAKAAGITPQAVRKRKNTLEKLTGR